MLAKLLYNISIRMGYENSDTCKYNQLIFENEQLRIVNNDLKNSLNPFIQIPKQISTKRIHTNGLRKCIVDTFGYKGLLEFDKGDSSFKLVDLKYFESFLEVNRVNYFKYVVTKFDCEDFSDVLMGDVTRWDGDLSFGTVWMNTPSGSHALNWLIDTDEHIWIVEPQSDSIFKLPNDWKLGNHLKM